MLPASSEREHAAGRRWATWGDPAGHPTAPRWSHCQTAPHQGRRCLQTTPGLCEDICASPNPIYSQPHTYEVHAGRTQAHPHVGGHAAGRAPPRSARLSSRDPNYSLHSHVPLEQCDVLVCPGAEKQRGGNSRLPLLPGVTARRGSPGRGSHRAAAAGQPSERAERSRLTSVHFSHSCLICS